jgi:hypothetical protein
VETVEIGANALVSPAAPERLADTIESQHRRWADGTTWERTLYGTGAAAEQIAAAVRSLIAA